MHRTVLVLTTTSVLATIVTLGATPACAQETTETFSHGERYEHEFIEEYGNGSTIYSVEVNGEIGGEVVNLSAFSRYFDPYDPLEVANVIPAPFGYDYQDTLVTVDAWSTPEQIDSWYDVIDIYSEDSYFSDVSDVVTVQQTAGDGPDAIVPIGWRGYCSDDGSSGATNFDGFDGAFAACDDSEDSFTVSPGSINVNTHTTTIYREVSRHFESVDDAYFDIYIARPLATSTTSSGTMTTFVTNTMTLRTDSYVTQLTGVVGGETLFAETADGEFGDAKVQTLLAELTAPRGYVFAGAPAVVAWSAPVLTESNTQLLTTSSETTTNTRSYEAITVTQTLGGSASIGDRGTCTSIGASGTITGLSPTGSFAECEGGVGYVLADGETNTNTHVTTVTETTVTTIVNQDWLTSEAYRVTGTAVTIGGIHSAVRDALFGGVSSFARKQGDSLQAGNAPGATLWADMSTSRTTRDTDRAGPGSEHEVEGIAGGVSVGLSRIVSAGVAISQHTSNSELAGVPESAEIAHTQVGLASGISLGAWRLALTASRGWVTIDSRRAEAAMGGVARADYDADTWHASIEIGREFSTGSLTLRPLAGIEWSRARLGAFKETGGVRLAGGGDSASRLAAMVGLQAATRFGLPGGPDIGLWAEARGGNLLDGEERLRAVVLADDPDTLLRVASADESGAFAEARAGADLFIGAIGLHLAGEARTGNGGNEGRASVGVSVAF